MWASPEQHGTWHTVGSKWMHSLGSTGTSWVLPSSFSMPIGRAESGTAGAARREWSHWRQSKESIRFRKDFPFIISLMFRQEIHFASLVATQQAVKCVSSCSGNHKTDIKSSSLTSRLHHSLWVHQLHSPEIQLTQVCMTLHPSLSEMHTAKLPMV